MERTEEKKGKRGEKRMKRRLMRGRKKEIMAERICGEKSKEEEMRGWKEQRGCNTKRK